MRKKFRGNKQIKFQSSKIILNLSTCTETEIRILQNFYFKFMAKLVEELTNLYNWIQCLQQIHSACLRKYSCIAITQVFLQVDRGFELQFNKPINVNPLH